MIVQEWNTKANVELKTPKELREFLTRCNPTVLNFYKEQIEILKPDIQIEGIGTSIKLTRKSNVKQSDNDR